MGGLTFFNFPYIDLLEHGNLHQNRHDKHNQTIIVKQKQRYRQPIVILVVIHYQFSAHLIVDFTMSGVIRTTCSALFMYLAMVFMVSTTKMAQPTTLVLAEQHSRNGELDRRLKLHSVLVNKNSGARERKRWYNIIGHKNNSPNTDKDSEYNSASSGMGSGKGDKGYGKGKGKGMMTGKEVKGKGNGKGSGLPNFCRELDFDVDDDDDDGGDDGFHGKGMGKSKKGKGKGKGYGDKMGMGKGFDKGYGKGKGKGSYEKVGCRRNVYKKARRISDISIFVSLIQQAELEDIFLCNGPFTVVAPSNAAFMNNTVITRYLSDVNNADDLRDVLLYHILPGLTRIDDFTRGPVDTLLDDDISVRINPVTFNKVATVEEGDFKACNGVIHIIDNILLPPGKIEELISFAHMM